MPNNNPLGVGGQLSDGEARNPTAAGGFQPGVSGNPSGRPRIPPHARRKLKRLLPRAIEVQEELMNHAESESVRLAASQYIINQNLGRPHQSVTVVQDDVLENLNDAQLLAVASGLDDDGN